MLVTLFRPFKLLVCLVFLGLATGLAQPAFASHLLGGEMTYKYLDANGPTAAPYRYELTTSVYVTCNSWATTTYLEIDFYNKDTGAYLPLTSLNAGSANASAYSGSLELAETSISNCTTIAVPAGCTITGASQPYQLQKFIGIVCLPASSAGYYALAAPGGARNAGINNLAGGASNGYYLGLYSTLAPPQYTNHSPVFVGDAVGLICAGDTTVVLNNAVDADGDRLEYAFGQPYHYPTSTGSFAPPPPYVPYTSTGGYSAATPLGTGTGYYAKINSSTGITKYVGGPTIGNRYSVAVDVTEFRTINGTEVVLGTTRRDIQLIVGNCPATAPPALPVAAIMPRSYTLAAGSTLSIPVTGTQPAGHPLTLMAASALLDGSGGYNATFAGNAGLATSAGSPVGAYMVTGTVGGTVAGTFVFTPACTDARATPYDVTLTLQDVGCAGKVVSDVLRITVVKPTGPTAIAGNVAVCGLGTQQTYTASGGTTPVQWTVTGGTIVGSATANPVTVSWPTAGAGTVTAQGVTQVGCPVGQVATNVLVSPAPTLTVTGNQAICQGASTTLTVAGGTAPYTLTGGAAPVSGAGPFVLSPTQTTTYTITSAGGGSACAATKQVTITVSPLPAANAGAAVTTCAGSPAQLGAAPVAGSTYSWNPATGLSSSTAANPTVTLANSTTAPITQTYTLTETTASGCQASKPVTVTVTPLPVAAPGAAVTICSGGTGQLGSAPVAGYTYSWSPATGLSSATAANPTVTLTNSTGAPITQTYTLTMTAGGTCSSTSTVAVTVTPGLSANAGAPIAFCSGGTGQLGAAPTAGYTYSWSPATGLSNASSANPIVTLTNTTGAPVTQTYTLTVSNPAASCTSSATVAVTVYPTPVAAAGAAVAFCSGGTGQLGAAPVAGATYSWSPATGLSSNTVANPTVTLANATGTPSTQVYTLTVTNAGSCTSTSTVAVTVNPRPVAAAGAAVTICSGGTEQLGAAAVAGNTYSWSPATGLSSPNAANPTVTLTNTTGAATTQTYTLTATNATNCTSTSTVTVTVNPQSVANAGAAVSFCSGGTGQLGSAPVAGYTYSWSPAAGLSNASSANPTVTLTNLTGAPITQTYTLTTTNAAMSCQSTGTVAVTVAPQPVAVAGAAVAFCTGGSASLGAAPVVGNAYSWSPATGLSSSTVANPNVTLTNTTGSPITQTYTLTVTSATNCVSTSTVAVTVNPLLAVTPGAAVAFCSGNSVQLGAAPVAGNTYSWSPTTGLSNAAVANPTVTLTNTTGAPVTQTYTLTVTNATTNCTRTGTVAVTVNPVPVAVPGAAVAFCSGGSASLGAAAATGYTYSWSPATGLSSPTMANPTVTLTNTTGAPITQTYTLTVTNAAGCASTGTVAVTVSPLSAATAGAPVAFCSGGSAQLGASPVAGSTYNWSPATGLSNASSSNPTVTLTNPTSAPITQTYTLTTTTATGGCAATGTVTVTVNPLPTANAGAPVAICSGGTGQLGTVPVAGATYSWSPATGLSSSTVANPTVTLTNATGAPIIQTYTLTVANASGCASTSTVAVTVKPLAVATAGNAVAFCSGGSAQLGAAPIAGNTYSWSPATGLSNSTAANPTVTLTNPTSAPITQTYTLTVTAGAGCQSSATVEVTVNPLPTANAGASVAICSGGTRQLGTAPMAGYTYSWSPATGLSSSTVANPIVILTNATGAPITQTYILTVANASGCAATSTVAVTVNPLSVATAGAAVAFCSGGTGQLGAAPVAGSTYSWSPATGLSSSTVANPTVTLANTTGAPITQTYTLTVTAAAGCQSMGTVAVTVNPLPVAAAGAPIAICSGGTGQLGAAPVAGYLYSWSPATGLSSATAANPTVMLTNATTTPTTQTYTLTTTNATTGCVSASPVVVTVNPLPIATPGAAITMCSGEAGTLGAAPVAGYTYSWSPATGLSNATAANPAVTLTNTTGSSITQTYTLTATNAAGCASTGTVAVTVRPAVVPGSIGADQTVCVGGVPAPLTSLAAASGGTGTYDYQWEISTDQVTWKAVANVSSLSYAPSAVTTTSYFRRRVIAGGCGMFYTNVVTVRAQLLLIPTVALPAPPTQCAGSALTFTPVPANAGAAPNYQWFVNGAPIGTGPAYTSSALADGDVVRVLLTPTPGFCATGTAIATVRVSFTPVPPPTLTIKLQTALPVCAGAPIRFTLDQATSIGTSPQYQWQVDGVAVSGATGSTFTSTTLRNGQAVSLLLRTTNACGLPATVTSGAVAVQVNPPVHVSAGPDQTIVEGESVVLQGTADGSYPVTWTPAQTLTFANGDQLHPVAAPTTTTTYVLSAGAGYCADQSSVTVTVLRRLRIPSAFSPNADNNDDTWQIAGIEDYPANRVQIFNRWGQKLYEAAGYSRSTEWNGTYNGELLPFGTYYYVVTLGNGKSYTGPLTVIR